MINQNQIDPAAYLPVPLPSPAAGNPLGTVDVARRHTVLIVDDEPNVVASLRDLLRLDYRVLTATRPADALDILQTQSVDIVLSDQRMPEMTGVELLGAVRARHPSVMRLLVTAYADIGAVIDAINRGSVYRYVTKPWNPRELATIVREAAERHDLLAERERLIAELQAKNDALETANLELARLATVKTQFIGVASHELRTPLTILLGLSGAASRRVDVSDELREWLQDISGAAGRLKGLVDDLTTMYSAQEFDRPLRPETVSLNLLLAQAGDDVAPFLGMRKQELTRDFSPEVGLVEVEVAKIRDSLNHLLLNAIKFSPDGARIILKARRLDDGRAEVTIADCGEGIPKADLARVFEPFFVGYDLTHYTSGIYEHKARGLGLGLSIAKAFVEMHGGQLSLENALTGGAVATLNLPANGRRRI